MIRREARGRHPHEGSTTCATPPELPQRVRYAMGVTDETPDTPSDAVDVALEADAVDSALADALDPSTFDTLASHLVWRIGRANDESPVAVRVGLPSAAAAFADLPRLRTATETELREALDSGEVRVEWVSPKGRSS